LLALFIIAGLIALIILLLCIPVETTIAMDTDSGRNYSLVVSWLFGIIKRDVGKGRSKKRKKIKSPGRKKRLSSRFDIDLMSQIVNTGGLLIQLKNLVTGIYRQIKINKISGDLVVGLEDPAYTGILFAVIGPANALLNLHPRYDVSIRPFFDDENIVEGNLYGNARVQPIRLINPVLKLASSKEVRQLGKDYIKQKWKRRRKHG
jgi:hypothetical protein